MIKKSYEYIKKFITENYLDILFILVGVATLTYPIPFYIYNGGGLINVDKKINFETKTESKGSYNMCYVSEIEATIPTYLYGLINNNWEIVKKETLTFNTKETSKDVATRDRIYLNNGNTNAIINAFKYANKEVKIISNRAIVIARMEEANNNIKIGDEIIEIAGQKINNIDDIDDAIANNNVGDKVLIKVINKDKEYERYAYIFEKDNDKFLGISIQEKIELETDPTINFNFDSDESGPSGGLILTLALYDYLVDEDLTKGLKISGTGTIDQDGNIGDIGGVKYKLAGAVKNKADIFFVPNGDNYEEAIKIQKEKKYNIKIIGVSTFEEAVKYLEEK